MTKEEVKKVLQSPNKELKLLALSYVSLGELEFDVIYLRYFKLLTQERAAERLPNMYAEDLGIPVEKAREKYSISTRSLQKVENRALDKFADVWGKIRAVQEILKIS